MQQEILSVSPSFPQTLEHFVPGRNLDMLFSLFHFRGAEIIQSPIYIFGPPQSGCTHLLRAATYTFESSLYWDASDHPDLFSLPLDGYTRIAIDNIMNLSILGQRRLHQLFIDHLSKQTHKLLLSGKMPPHLLPLCTDIREKMLNAICYKIEPLTDEEKRDYLMKLARSRGLSLKEEVARFIMGHVQKDMSSLRYWLDQIDEVSLREKRDITESLVRYVLEKEQLTT